MSKEQIVRTAADNKYLHRHFHNIMNISLEYLRRLYGGEAVSEYLKQFANTYYAPLRQRIREGGLAAVMEYFRGIYEAEEASGDISFYGDSAELTVKVSRCPAVAHMRKSGMEVSPLYVETSRVIWQTICEGTSYGYELIFYDGANGASVQRFYRKADEN